MYFKHNGVSSTKIIINWPIIIFMCLCFPPPHISHTLVSFAHRLLTFRRIFRNGIRQNARACSTLRKTCPVLLCPPQILHGQAWYQTRVSALRFLSHDTAEDVVQEMHWACRKTRAAIFELYWRDVVCYIMDGFYDEGEELSYSITRGTS